MGFIIALIILGLCIGLIESEGKKLDKEALGGIWEIGEKYSNIEDYIMGMFRELRHPNENTKSIYEEVFEMRKQIESRGHWLSRSSKTESSTPRLEELAREMEVIVSRERIEDTRRLFGQRWKSEGVA